MELCKNQCSMAGLSIGLQHLLEACLNFLTPVHRDRLAPHVLLLPRFSLALFKLKRSDKTFEQRVRVETFQNSNHLLQIMIITDWLMN